MEVLSLTIQRGHKRLPVESVKHELSLLYGVLKVYIGVDPYVYIRDENKLSRRCDPSWADYYYDLLSNIMYGVHRNRTIIDPLNHDEWRRLRYLVSDFLFKLNLRPDNGYNPFTKNDCDRSLERIEEIYKLYKKDPLVFKLEHLQ